MIVVCGAGAGRSVRRTAASTALKPAAIASSMLLHGLSAEALFDVAMAGRLRRARKGTAIFEQGAPADRLFILLQGRVRAVQSTPEGHQLTARFLRPGDPFGCVVLMGVDTYPLSAIAETDSLIAGWPAGAMARFAMQYPQIALNALRYVGRQLRDTQARLQETVTEGVEQRIARALLRLVAQAGRKTPDGIEISFPISRQDVAELAGSAMPTVSRTISKWQVNGIIKAGRQRIVVAAPHRLVMIAEQYR